jgi:hypothetical protein
VTKKRYQKQRVEAKTKNQKHIEVDAQLVQMRFYNPAMTGTVSPGGVRVAPPMGQYVPTPPAFRYGAPGHFTSPTGVRVYTLPVRQPVFPRTPSIAPGAPRVSPVSPAGRPRPDLGLFEMYYTMPGLLGGYLNPYR